GGGEGGSRRESPPSSTRDVDMLVARMDALAALRRRDQLEAEAPVLLNPGTYLEPFALRALGIVRPDPELIDKAEQRFQDMGLEWHAAETAAVAESAHSSHMKSRRPARQAVRG